MAIIEGKKPPAFTLRDAAGKAVALDDFKGKDVVVYFYPKDDTPGCTKQACAYRDDSARFQELGVKVFGVSLDDLDSHAAFRDKFSLNFPLISDPNHALADFFGVYGEREWKGNKFMGLSRDTFVIDPSGKVVRTFRNVNPLTTSQETYDVVKALVQS